MPHNNSMQRTALRAAADAERQLSTLGHFRFGSRLCKNAEIRTYKERFPTRANVHRARTASNDTKWFA